MAESTKSAPPADDAGLGPARGREAVRRRAGPPGLGALLAGLLLLAAGPARPAEAIIPGVLAPFQALLSFIPQILLAGLLAVSVIFRPEAWRHLWAKLKERPRASAVAAVALVAGVTAWALWPPPAGQLGVRPGLGAGGGSGTENGGGAAPAAGPAAWHTFMGDFSRTGRADDRPGPRAGKAAWTFGKPGAASYAASAAYALGALVVGGDDGKVYCLAAADGALRWTFPLKHGGYSSPAIAGGRVYVGEGDHETADARLYCLDLASGAELWSFGTASHLESGPTVSGDRVYAGAGEDGVYCLDAVDGHEVWHFRGPHVDTSPAFGGGRVYFGSGWGERLIYCLDAGSGAPVWTRAARFQAWGPPALAAGRLYLGTGDGDYEGTGPNRGGEVLCLEAATGTDVWRFPTDGPVLTAVALSGATALVGSHDGNAYALDAATGKLRWKFATGGRVIGSPATDGVYAYVPSGCGKLFALALADGAVAWTFDARAASAGAANEFVASPTLAGGRLYIGAQSHFFFCIE